MSSAIFSNTALARIAVVINGISLGGPVSWDGSGSYGRSLQVGAQESAAQGYPSSPSLELSQQGFWRFRWTVLAGTRTVSIAVMQPINVTPYPTLVVKQNPSIGVNSDVTATSPGGASWVTLGPATVSPSSEGVLWVELHNNISPSTVAATLACATILGIAPAYFGQISVT